MSQSLLSATQGRSVFRIGLLASTIAAFLPTHVNSYASSPSTTSGESICFSSSKLTARLYTFFSGVLRSSSSISVTQLGNRAAMRSMFCAVISGDSNFIFSIRLFLLLDTAQFDKWQLLEPASKSMLYAYRAKTA